MAAPTRYTRADLRTRLADRWEGVPWWDTASADDAINEALLLWNLCTGQWRTRQTYPTTAGTIDYQLLGSLVFGTRLQWNTFPLDPTSLWELDQGRPGWRVETTATGGSVPTRPMLWAPVSLNLIHIWPADALGGNLLLVNGVAATPQLTQDAQYLDLGEELLAPLLDGALHIASFREGADRFLATRAQWTSFLTAAATHNSQLKSSLVFRRWLGLDRGRDLRPTRGAPQLLPPSQAGGTDGGS